MIATGGVITGLAALKRQDSARSQHHLPIQMQPADADKKKAKRKPRSDVVVVRGKIRLYSASGFFLVLGVLVLMAGIAMAVLGYWPHKEPHLRPSSARLPSTNDVSASGNVSRVKPEPGGVVAQFFEQHLHSEKMKMLGPFTMGIGIFIFICANAILHENRDRETKIIHMRDMYSTVIDIHSLRVKEHKFMNGGSAYSGPYAEHEVSRTYHHHENQCASRLAANTLLSFSGIGNDVRLSRRASSAEEEEGLLSEAKGGLSHLGPNYRERSGSIFGLQPECGRPWDDRSKKCQTGSIVSSSISAFTLPVIKLNNCVIDEPDIDSITEDLESQVHAGSRPPSMESLTVPMPDIAKAYKPPTVTLLRSNSATDSSLSSCFSQASLSPMSASSRFLSPGAARKDFGSNSSIHMLSAHSKSLDLERGHATLTVQTEQRKHPSWPRLDRSNSKGGYMKLENKEDPMDRLLVPPMAIKRDYTKKEKLLMISRSHNNLSFEHDEFMSSSLKRGTSETRF
ncbi:transmembrane protein 200A [Alosa sapidissima]|uniref:transmembrane protein 200A n=1 Tax=Alosa sapidissima TaxID=34773 RepID=UPI001C093FD6|nr:transmembrane protein 200A [Alosa sapidissima]XP_041952110.1 transmembrane protein 200A [Alosa sapidissima]XP_041952111.1 transmembrane protein 200A [Alosa sapidissima]XP_041952112.1 transmembrane protein 200A [Alosa sapidissima]XP_041952113.1 transmembrane protein 200A [Alosa sapidissima]